jgi:hypothetical protein
VSHSEEQTSPLAVDVLAGAEEARSPPVSPGSLPTVTSVRDPRVGESYVEGCPASYLMSSPFRLSELVVGAKKPNLDFTLGRM